MTGSVSSLTSNAVSNVGVNIGTLTFEHLFNSGDITYELRNTNRVGILNYLYLILEKIQ